MMFKRKAQSTLEYTVLVVIIIAVFITMQMYFKRGFQGRWKSTVDDFGEQYDPDTTNSQTDYSLISNSETQIGVGHLDLHPITGQPGYYTTRLDNTTSVETKNGNTIVGSN